MGISPKCAAHRAKCYLIHGIILFGRICVTLYRPPLLTLAHWKESRSGWKEETPLNTSKGNITKMCTASCNKISSYLWSNNHHREIYHNSFIYILVFPQLISATTCDKCSEDRTFQRWKVKLSAFEGKGQSTASQVQFQRRNFYVTTFRNIQKHVFWRENKTHNIQDHLLKPGQ